MKCVKSRLSIEEGVEHGVDPALPDFLLVVNMARTMQYLRHRHNRLVTCTDSRFM